MNIAMLLFTIQRHCKGIIVRAFGTIYWCRLSCKKTKNRWVSLSNNGVWPWTSRNWLISFHIQHLCFNGMLYEVIIIDKSKADFPLTVFVCDCWDNFSDSYVISDDLIINWGCGKLKNFMKKRQVDISIFESKTTWFGSTMLAYSTGNLSKLSWL